MKTREEILANWETEQYNNWCAIDSYDPISGQLHRLFVGTEEECDARYKAYYMQPATIAESVFYRYSIISSNDARLHFGGVDAVLDERGEYTITEAAGILNISRQRVHKLLQDGLLDGHKRGNTWFIYRYSIENRMNNH